MGQCCWVCSAETPGRAPFRLLRLPQSINRYLVPTETRHDTCKRPERECSPRPASAAHPHAWRHHDLCGTGADTARLQQRAATAPAQGQGCGVALACCSARPGAPSGHKGAAGAGGSGHRGGACKATAAGGGEQAPAQCCWTAHTIVTPRQTVPLVLPPPRSQASSSSKSTPLGSLGMLANKLLMNVRRGLACARADQQTRRIRRRAWGGQQTRTRPSPLHAGRVAARGARPDALRVLPGHGARDVQRLPGRGHRGAGEGPREPDEASGCARAGRRGCRGGGRRQRVPAHMPLAAPRRLPLPAWVAQAAS